MDDRRKIAWLPDFLEAMRSPAIHERNTSMRDPLRGFLLFGLILIVGCDGPAKPPSVAAPHGGRIYSLGDGAGFVELLAKTEGDPRDRKTESEITAYFLDASGKKAMDPPPTDVKATFNIPKPKSIPMNPMPDPGDPVGGAKFVSPAGTFGGDDIKGQLEATSAGARISISFEIR
jgi:hypothetical protein